MSEKLHEMLAFVLEKKIGIAKSKARSVASYFATLEEFINLEAANFMEIKSISGKRTLRLTDDEIARILAFNASGNLSSQLTLAENF